MEGKRRGKEVNVEGVQSFVGNGLRRVAVVLQTSPGKMGWRMVGRWEGGVVEYSYRSGGRFEHSC